MFQKGVEYLNLGFSILLILLSISSGNARKVTCLALYIKLCQSGALSAALKSNGLIASGLFVKRGKPIFRHNADKSGYRKRHIRGRIKIISTYTDLLLDIIF
jgi:hypothetical protein